MKVNGRKIIENLHLKSCHPTKTNFSAFCHEVEEFLLLECALNRGNITRESIANISKASETFTRKSKKIWEQSGKTIHTVI